MMRILRSIQDADPVIRKLFYNEIIGQNTWSDCIHIDMAITSFMLRYKNGDYGRAMNRRIHEFAKDHELI